VYIGLAANSGPITTEIGADPISRPSHVNATWYVPVWAGFNSDRAPSNSSLRVMLCCHPSSAIEASMRSQGDAKSEAALITKLCLASTKNVEGETRT